ncbi:MAG: hypothetical protein AB7F25_13815 [Deferribacterales bacterium]
MKRRLCTVVKINQEVRRLIPQFKKAPVKNGLGSQGGAGAFSCLFYPEIYSIHGKISQTLQSAMPHYAHAALIKSDKSDFILSAGFILKPILHEISNRN